MFDKSRTELLQMIGSVSLKVNVWTLTDEFPAVPEPRGSRPESLRWAKWNHIHLFCSPNGWDPSAGRRSMSRSMRLSHENQRLPWKLHLSSLFFSTASNKAFNALTFCLFMHLVFFILLFPSLSLPHLLFFLSHHKTMPHLKSQTKSKIHKIYDIIYPYTC